MELNRWASEDHENEYLLAEVVALRTQLQETERHLKNLGEELHSTNEQSNSDLSIDDGELGVLTMEDLIDPGELPNSSSHSAVNRTSWCDGDSPRKLQKKCYSQSFDKTMEEENELLRDKLNVLRGKNELLTSQNHELMTEVETINFELKQTKARVSLLESALGTHSVSIPMLEEQIASLEAEVQAQDSVLKDTEDKLEQSQKMTVEKEYALQKLKEDYKKMKLNFIERAKQGKRTEQQRDEALYNAEELTRTFKKYKEKITDKLEKVQAEEQILERNLVDCVKEKEKLQAKCESYRSELENMKEQLRQLVEETCIGKENLRHVEAKNSEMELLQKHSQQKIQLLESRLQEQDRLLEEKNALIKENADFKALIAEQQNQLQSYQQDTENSKIELKTLENVISQLSQSSLKEVNHSQHPYNEAACANCSESSRTLIEELRLKLKMKEAEIQNLQAEHRTGKIAREENEGQELQGLETEPVKLTEDQTERKCKQLEITIKQLEKEKQIISKQLEDFNSKLEKSEEENNFLKDTMAQRTSQFQAIQEELLEKAAKSTTLEREVKKTVAYTTAAAKNTELEQELVKLNSQLHSFERKIKEEHEQFSLMLEKTKMVHLEQHKEMGNQIELLQSRLETKNQQFLEQENTLTILQQDILRKQRQIESLDQLLTESKEEIEKQKVKKEEAIQRLQGQLSEETVKVKQLQTALDICKDDLALNLSHIEENRALFVQRLQKEIRLKNGNLQSTTEQNLILQQTLQQQQQMLHQETIRNSELEDSQTKLQKQVSTLEHELQKQRENLEEELRKTNEKLHLASEETDLKRQKVTELTGTISQIKIEMDQCKDELIDMEKELVHLRRDGHTKAMQLGHLEMTLEQKVSELHEKTQQVRELEDKLLVSEKQQKDAAQKIQTLENDVQNANAELKNTLRQLQDLRDVLQNAQMSLEEKYAAIQDLTEELRECKDELEEKKQELLDMDKALKERNWDLKQRAAQITKLDMSIREHRGELEQKIITLEAKLEKAELQIKECNKQIESLEHELKRAKNELHEKEFDILQQDQEINRHKKEIERKQPRVKDMEKKMKEQEKCIAEQYKEILDLGQQLRLEREQMQHIHGELLESRRQQAQAQRDVDRISLELEELNHLCLEKESRANYLAEELGAAQAREMQLEARMQAEVKRLSGEIESLNQTYLSEKLSHEAQQAKWRQSISKSHHVRGQLQQLKLELDEAQGTVCNLQQQLQSRNEIIQAANEALLLKESEVTRLQARISGHERTEGIRQLSVPQWPNAQELDLTKHSQTSSSPHRKWHPPTSNNDLGIENNGNFLNREQLFTLDSSVTCGETKDVPHPLPASLNESSFDPLTHVGDGDLSCDSNDFETLSGMLRYINNEMKTSENSSI
ncbi:hypothetical protein JRQ81_014640 [Phrynocephalus forsythii]|uniref:Coiled-coil domain-containing protein 18 n=1 Tax=Phrynocephalus forsythii TaxID=171643 RepID=A0A9Q1B3Q0_9SAUR|nr:hypothetical protein JRQ81_014640 [Phrynocephalus forsythii]